VNSSQRAQLILGALWFVSTLTLTSAQLRILADDTRRVRRYGVGWTVCTLVVGGVLTYVDRVTGRVDISAQLGNFVLAGVVGAVALAAGGWVEARAPRAGRARFLRLALLHGALVAITYPFI
jgi:hypothetical protein